MNTFDHAIYSFFDLFKPSQIGITVIFLGGFVGCAICGMLILTPLLKGIPLRILLAIGSILPIVVAVYATKFNLVVHGRHPGIMIALSPIVIALVPTLMSLALTFSTSSKPVSWRYIAINSCLFLMQLWATLAIWLATDYGFMGASC
jgi:hypothetical protein